MDFNFDIFPSLKTKRLLLREATYNDTNAIFDLRSNKEINKYVGTKLVENLLEARNFITICNELYQKRKRIFWVIEYEKKVIGSIVLHKIDLEKKYTEIGYKLKIAYQKKGLMSEAIQSVLNFGIVQMNLKTIEAFTHKNNTSSILLLKKHHFEYQPERRCKVYDFNRIWKLDYRKTTF